MESGFQAEKSEGRKPPLVGLRAARQFRVCRNVPKWKYHCKNAPSRHYAPPALRFPFSALNTGGRAASSLVHRVPHAKGNTKESQSELILTAMGIVQGFLLKRARISVIGWTGRVEFAEAISFRCAGPLCSLNLRPRTAERVRVHGAQLPRERP